MVKVTEWVTKAVAQELINRHVAKGSTVVTNGLSMYAYLSKEAEFTPCYGRQ